MNGRLVYKIDCIWRRTQNQNKVFVSPWNMHFWWTFHLGIWVVCGLFTLECKFLLNFFLGMWQKIAARCLHIWTLWFTTCVFLYDISIFLNSYINAINGKTGVFAGPTHSNTLQGSSVAKEENPTSIPIAPVPSSLFSSNYLVFKNKKTLLCIGHKKTASNLKNVHVRICSGP